MGKKYIIELEDNESVYKTVYNTIIAYNTFVHPKKKPPINVIIPSVISIAVPIETLQYLETI